MAVHPSFMFLLEKFSVTAYLSIPITIKQALEEENDNFYKTVVGSCPKLCYSGNPFLPNSLASTSYVS
jgi:hypothetical protein